MRQVPPHARPGGTAGGVTSLGNTAEFSRELSVGDLVDVGDILLAVGRPAGWEPVTGPLTGVRTREYGSSPLPLTGHAPGSGGLAPETREGEPR